MFPLLMIALSAQSSPETSVARRLFTVENALFKIPEVTGRIQGVSDCNGDGCADIVAERGTTKGSVRSTNRLDILSAKDGTLIRTIWKQSHAGPLHWDVNSGMGDAAAPILVVGLPAEDDARGHVLVISTSSGALIHKIMGSAPNEALGSAVAILGDVDGDSYADFAIGGVQFDPQLAKIPSPAADCIDWRGARFADKDPSNDQLPEMLTKALLSRSALPGFVTLRSGCTGAELWRAVGQLPGGGYGDRLSRAGDVDADGVSEILVLSSLRVTPTQLLSGRTGIASVRYRAERFDTRAAGDLDGDGSPDLMFENAGADFFNAATGKYLGFIPPLDSLPSSYAMSCPVGDLDMDGCTDIAIGEPNFNIKSAEQVGVRGYAAPDLSKLSLAQAMAIESNPWHMGWESGAAVIFSGRTRTPLLGVFGQPGTSEGIGLGAIVIPDANGDGRPDVLVQDEATAYAFASPSFGDQAK